jgi:hypothetical protein
MIKFYNFQLDDSIYTGRKLTDGIIIKLNCSRPLINPYCLPMERVINLSENMMMLRKWKEQKRRLVEFQIYYCCGAKCGSYALSAKKVFRPQMDLG